MKAQLFAPKMIVLYLFFAFGFVVYLRGDATPDQIVEGLLLLTIAFGVLKVEEFRRALKESKR